MTPYEATRRLAVSRTLADGSKVAVGTLAQNRDGVYFAYDAAYLQQYGNLSPYHLRADGSVQLFYDRYESTNIRRLVTGTLFGVGLGFLLFQLITAII